MFRVKLISFWPKISQSNKRTSALAHKCEGKFNPFKELSLDASLLNKRDNIEKSVTWKQVY